MNDRRHVAALACKNDRDRDESAFGEDHIRIQELDKSLGFSKSFDYPERVSEVLHTEIAAQLSGRDTMVGNTKLFDQFLLNAVVRADIMDIVL